MMAAAHYDELYRHKAEAESQEEVIMPVVIVEMWEGRTLEQKKKLAEGITSVMTNLGIPASAVQIIIKDNPKYNWAVAGKLCSE